MVRISSTFVSVILLIRKVILFLFQYEASEIVTLNKRREEKLFSSCPRLFEEGLVSSADPEIQIMQKIEESKPRLGSTVVKKIFCGDGDAHRSELTLLSSFMLLGV